MNQLKRLNPLFFRLKNYYPTLNVQYSNNLYEPDYLEYMVPKIPLHDTLNIQIRSHDYAILENYQRFIHTISKNLDINVEDSWAIPVQDMKITTLKPKSEIVQSNYQLKTYQRTVQVTDVSSVQLPILLRVLNESCPVGVDINVANHEEYHEEVRYIPDSELITLKVELEEMGGPRKVK